MTIIASGYVLHVECDYCTTPYRKKDEFFGKTESLAFKELRESGWKYFPAQGKVKCKACVTAAHPK